MLHLNNTIAITIWFTYIFNLIYLKITNLWCKLKFSCSFKSLSYQFWKHNSFFLHFCFSYFCHFTLKTFKFFLFTSECKIGSKRKSQKLLLQIQLNIEIIVDNLSLESSLVYQPSLFFPWQLQKILLTKKRFIQESLSFMRFFTFFCLLLHFIKLLFHWFICLILCLFTLDVIVYVLRNGNMKNIMFQMIML